MVSTQIGFDDTPAVDAFGRLRVAEPATIFDNKLLNGKNDLVWDEIVTNVSGDAASTFDTNHVDLEVGANAGDYVIRQTKMRFNYLPGKSHLILQTFVFGSGSATKRVGYWNCDNIAPYTGGTDGIWFEMRGGAHYWCIARGGVKTEVEQSDWNTNRMQAGNASRAGDSVVLNPGTPLIMFIDMEWLGVGRVRVGFIINGAYVVVHQFRFANNQGGSGLTVPYIDSPNHSLRFEIRSTGEADLLREICGSVQSEGGYDLVGNLYSANRGITGFTTANNTATYPLMSLRLDSDRKDGTIIIKSGSMFCTTTANYLWTLRFNPTIAGTDAASWVPIGGNSSAEYDVSRNNTNTVTGGTILASGYGADTNQAIGQLNFELNSAVRPGVSIAGVQDELVLCTQNISNGLETYFAALNWREPL